MPALPPLSASSVVEIEFASGTRMRIAGLLESIGNIPPAEAEANYYATLEEPRMAA